MLTGGELAALIVAVAWAILVVFLAVVLVKLGRVLTEATTLVSGVSAQTVPLLGEVRRAGRRRASGAGVHP